MQKRLFTFALLTLLSQYATAKALAPSFSDNNDCAYLSVMISNNTANNCELTQKTLVHGNMSSSSQVPLLISAYSSSNPFSLRQTLYGPDIILTYQCGPDTRITFESQQNVCYFSAGAINGTIHSHIGIHAEYTKEEGSAWWGRHGSISWKLH